MTLATNYSTSNTAGVDLTAVWAAASNTAGTWGENVLPYPPFAAGTVILGLNGAKYIYVKLGTGGATGAGYFMVAPLNDYSGAVMASDSVGNIGDPCGVWMGGVALIGDYGFIQTGGLNTTGVRVAALCAHNVALGTTATAGVLDDSGSTHTLSGVWITTTVVGAGLSPAQLNNPVVAT